MKSSIATLFLALASCFDVAVAIDYAGSWLPGPSKTQCIDICINSNPKPTCFTKQPDCMRKKQLPGDYDFLLLEQLYVPQFCRDLLNGVDSTVSHQNVNPFPDGIQCQQSPSLLTIHGLWPNYNDGYPACCKVSSSIPNRPFHAAQFAANHSDLLQEMSTKWIDPTQEAAYDSLCEIYNHEFQKHGFCYAAFGDDYDQAAVTYFEATLQAARQMEKATEQINDWAASASGAIPSLKALEALYPQRIQALCSNVDNVKNRLSAIRTCFEKPTNPNGPFRPMDCPRASATKVFALCDPSQPISLEGYTPPN